MIKLKSLLVEQTNVWATVTPEGVGAETRKVIYTNIPAVTQLTTADGKPLYFNSGEAGTPIYVGADIEAVYREKQPVQTIPDENTFRNSGRFGCEVTIYMSDQSNSDGKTAGRRIDTVQYKIVQKKTKKFLLVPAVPIDSDSVSADLGFGYRDEAGKFQYASGEMAMSFKGNIGYKISWELKKCIGDTFSKINTELARLGFPTIPASVNPTTGTTVS
jgi:hypothetical protein